MNIFRCLAVDMGASSVRILLGEISANQIQYKEISRFKNEIKTINKTDKWDIEDIYSKILFGISRALKLYPEVESIGIDSWGVDYVLIDAKGKLIELPYAYRDVRTKGMMTEWEKHMSRDETFRRTGINFYIFNTLFQLLAARQSNEIKKADALLFIPSYINFLLCGKKINELSISSTSQLLEANSNKFDQKIIKLLNAWHLNLEHAINPGKIIGTVTEKKLPKNKLSVVSVCSHDTASAVAATPSSSDEFIFLSTGTWCILGVEAKKPIITNEALEFGFTNERSYGNKYKLLKNIVGLWLIQGIRKAMPKNLDFSEIEKILIRSKHADQLIDPDDDLFYKPENMLEAFDIYFEKTGQKKPETYGQYIKCAYNSLSLSFVYYIEKLEYLCEKSYNTIHLIGGGSQSEYLCQTTADFSMKNVIAGPVECSTIGNILVQAIAFKKIKDLRDGRAIVKNSFLQTNFKPKIAENRRMDLYQKFIKLKEQKYVGK
ncbi:MAG: rhamnulokinase [Bacteroidetes bacterium]|jgi:rhamnulokinase|nr:rhamnulokinase [Bacteroidota bacterium]MBT6685046.1 rhamnulokinase [Bacteroidota bacterium]MBT7143185.1 rhamnulokinase [Bacteroidota bacterium]MBT7491007.1 rhamnulokinase [Bacteroidota bacterium]